MTKRILVGVDGSETAGAAARTAAGLAVALDAELTVLSAYGKFELERVQAGSEEFVFSTEKDAEKIAEQSAVALRHLFPDLRIVVRAAEGKPAEALVREAEETDADLIVVGNKRVQGLARVLGSIAADVARRAPCDVYVAHTHQR